MKPMATAIKTKVQNGNSDFLSSLALHYGQIAMENQGLPAIMRERQVITHGQFWEIVKSFATHMKNAGVTKSALVALNTTDILGSIAVLFATSLLGARFN